MDEKSLLQKLVQFDTINDPVNDLLPNSNILNFIEQKVREWNSKFKFQLFEDQGYSSLFFTIHPHKKCEVLFIGHLDVVPIGQGWLSDPFSLNIASGLGYGRGTKDCKGSVASALIMLEKLCREKNPYLKKIGFFFSTDEETGGQYGTKVFFNHAKEHDILPRYVINVDGGPRVIHKRRAGFGVKINLLPKIIKGNGLLKSQRCQTRIMGDDNRHSAYFVRGCDTHALVALSKLLHLNRDWRVQDIQGAWVKGNVIPDYVEANIAVMTNDLENKLVNYDINLTKILRQIRSLVLIDLQTEISSEFGVTVNPNLVSYSSTKGIEIYFDVRAFLSSEKTNTLVNAFKQRLSDLSVDAVVECPGTSGYFYTVETSPLVEVATKVLRKFSLPSDTCEQEGASDSRYASEHNVPTIDLGPKGGNIHGANEFIDLTSMREFASIYEEIVINLLAN